MDFRFRLAENEEEIDDLTKFILAQPLDYPFFGDWVEKMRYELSLGYKTCILAFSKDFLIGSLIFQPHKQFSSILEAKSMRVHNQFRGRYCGVFMFKQMEIEAEINNYGAVVCDIRTDNLRVLSLLKFMGYEELIRAPLYDENVEDVIMAKRFKRTPKGILIPLSNKFA